jgi:hypothetical protein
MNLIGYVKIAAAFALAALIGIAFWKTYDAGYDKAAAIGATNLANYKATIAQASAKAASVAFGRYAADVTRAQAAESGFLNIRRTDDNRAEALKEQIDAVSQPYVPAPPQLHNVQSAATVTPLYSCRFSIGFVRLWNAAAGIADDSDAALQASAYPGGVTGGSSSDATTDSGVSQADILHWFIDYANRAHGTENKLKAIRDLQPASQTAAATAPQ